MGYLGNVINKAHVYDQYAKQLETASGAKVIWCMVDYSTKMEKLLKELHALLQPVGVQPEPAPTPAPAPAPTPVPFPITSPEMVTLSTDRLDPTLQEEIPEINTEDITSLETWAVGRAQNMTTPKTRSQGTNLPGNLSIPGLASQEARRKTEERTKMRAEESVSKSRS